MLILNIHIEKRLFYSKNAVFFWNIVILGEVARIVGFGEICFVSESWKWTKAEWSVTCERDWKDLWWQEFYAPFKIMKNSYWENVMHSQFTLHAASNLICTSTGKHLLTTEIVSFSLLQLELIVVQEGWHESQNEFNYK